jgi:hypothetical protein
MAPRLTAARRCCRDGPHLQPGGFGMIETGLRVHSACWGMDVVRCKPNRAAGARGRGGARGAQRSRLRGGPLGRTAPAQDRTCPRGPTRRRGLLGLNSSEHARHCSQTPLGPSAPLGRAQCSTEKYVDHLVHLAAAAVSSLKRAGAASGAMTVRGETGCRGRGLCFKGKIRVCGVSEPCDNFTGA